MPSANTFSIAPIKRKVTSILLDKKRGSGSDFVSVDPFANDSCLKSLLTYTNDIDPSMKTTHNMDALEFLKSIETGSVDVVLFDPPYSTRQVSECYKKFDMTVNLETTQAIFWTNLKVEIYRVLKPEGVCVSCSWNSGGIGKKLGMKIEEIMLVAHGGWHNDTIITIERKLRGTKKLF